MARADNVVYPAYDSIPQDAENISLSDTLNYNNTAGFVSHEDGTLAVKMHSGREASFPVKAGVQYVGSIDKFLATGSTGITTVTVFY